MALRDMVGTALRSTTLKGCRGTRSSCMELNYRANLALGYNYHGHQFQRGYIKSRSLCRLSTSPKYPIIKFESCKAINDIRDPRQNPLLIPGNPIWD